ncbi:MAG: DUF2807 domain-containing protein [Dehalococcoidaceae bacterium]|nr:DUF2807 domain-containing protein [Dehalococcoidaceae bacterium]
MNIKKVILPALAAILVFGLSLTGCGDTVRGSGNVESRNFDFSGFDEVQISGVFKYLVTRSESFSISVTADDNLYEYIEVSQQGSKLIIKLKPLSIRGSVTLEVAINLPAIESLSGSGATRGTLSGFDSDGELEIAISGASVLDLSAIKAGATRLNVSGASKVTGDIEMTAARLDVSGASVVELEGEAVDIEASVSGASKLDLEDFPSASIDIQVDGASNGTVRTDGELNARVSGASRLEYIGEPNLGDIEVSGASTFTRKPA